MRRILETGLLAAVAVLFLAGCGEKEPEQATGRDDGGGIDVAADVEGETEEGSQVEKRREDSGESRDLFQPVSHAHAENLDRERESEETAERNRRIEAAARERELAMIVERVAEIEARLRADHAARITPVIERSETELRRRYEAEIERAAQQLDQSAHADVLRELAAERDRLRGGKAIPAPANPELRSTRVDDLVDGLRAWYARGRERIEESQANAEADLTANYRRHLEAMRDSGTSYAPAKEVIEEKIEALEAGWNWEGESP